MSRCPNWDSWEQVVEEAAAAFVGMEMEAPAGGGGAEGGECRSQHWKTSGERRRCHGGNECTSCGLQKKLASPSPTVWCTSFLLCTSTQFPLSLV